jgi:hypothetical protein
MLVDRRPCWYLLRNCLTVELQKVYFWHFSHKLQQLVGVYLLALIQTSLMLRKLSFLFLKKLSDIRLWAIIKLSPSALISIDDVR